MSAGFTPGPWAADFGEAFRIRESDGSSVAYTQFVHLHGRRDTEEVTANANLIAAAPELYGALKEASQLCLDELFEWQRTKARAVLAKANGEQVHSDPLPKQVGR